MNSSCYETPVRKLSGVTEKILKIRQQPFSMTWLMILLIFMLFVGGRAAINIHSLYGSAIASGSNTVGEAGKVYYAKKFIEGQSIFSSGDTAPFYPSFHGALLHSMVGVIGRIFHVKTNCLYYIGRGMSILFTILTLCLLSSLLRHQNVSWMWSIAILLLFFSAMPIIAHTSSYRPDNWVLFFSVLAAYILIVSPERVKTLILLAIIPVVTFYIKATGLYIGIAVFINLLLADRLRDAVRYALLFFTFFGLTVVALHFGTDGAFSSGLTTGAQVKYSWFLAIQCLSVSQLWIFIILPILIGTHLRHSNTIFRKEQIVLLTFFMVSLITGVITSRRLGANSYYYLDCFTFGIVISIGWLAHYCQNLSKLKFSNPQNTALAALILLFIFQSFPSTNEIQGFLQGRLPQDIALYRTKLYQDDREKLSELCNQNKLKCFSDDEGLNVMLDNPQIIFPMVQTMLIQSGLLNIASIVSPVERQEYDIIALTGSQWKYFNVDPFPKEFKESLSLNYQEFRTPFKYHIFRPKNIKNN